MNKCEQCLYNKNCQFLATHKKANVEGCTAFEDKSDIWIENALEYCKDCSANLNIEIIDLINRKQAEVERLNKEVDRLSQIVLYNDGIVSDLEKDLFNAKADAIKKFAERFENELTKIEEFYFEEEHENFISANKVIALIVNLVAEMVGE